MKKARFIAVDVDGTLLDDHDHYDSRRLDRDINQLADQGVQFIIASGDSYDELATLFPSKKLLKNLVAENGGRVFANGQEMVSKSHRRQTLVELLNWATRLVPQPDLLSLSGQGRTYILRRYQSVPVPFYPHHAYFDRLEDIPGPIYNLNLSWFQQRIDTSWIRGVAKRLNQLSPTVNATYSGAYGIDILPAGVNKAVGLRHLLKELGGNITELIAFGDTSNDLEMFQAAGKGYAMKNATPDLKKVADKITVMDNNHNGLLNEIERIFSL